MSQASNSEDQAAQWPVKRYMIFGTIVLVLFLGGFGTWAVLTQISGAVVSSGSIVVDRNRLILQHPDGGQVVSILVDEGDHVERDALLVVLDSTTLVSERIIVESQLFELMSRRARAQAEREEADTIIFPALLHEEGAKNPEVERLMSGQEGLFYIRRDSDEQARAQLDKRKSQIKSQIEGVIAQRSGLTRQLALIQEELVAQQELLDRGLTQASRVLALRREEAGLEGRVGELIATEAQAQGRITEFDTQILQLRIARREQAIEEERNLEFRENELSEKRQALIGKIARLEIRAPVAGVVYNFIPRSVISPAETVLSLVPSDRVLVIEAKVSPVHIDQVLVGQEATLRFSTFDQRTTPELFGTVRTISPDAFFDQNTGETFYQAELVLNPGEIEKIPEGAKLIPGMPVQAFLRTRDRSPINYLTKPLTDYFVRAFRD